MNSYTPEYRDEAVRLVIDSSRPIAEVARELDSQLKSCSSSEVAAMMEGLLHHGTDVPVTADYTDTHGASVIGFAFTHLLGYQLLPRLKDIGRQRLYLPDTETGARLPHLAPVLTRAIRWDLIAQQYDQMVKYASILKLRTAERP